MGEGKNDIITLINESINEIDNRALGDIIRMRNENGFPVIFNPLLHLQMSDESINKLSKLISPNTIKRYVDDKGAVSSHDSSGETQ